MLRTLFVVLLLIVSNGVMAEKQANMSPRTITVSGTGAAEVAPDKALLRMSIVAREPTLAAAQKNAAAVAAEVLKVTDRLKIDRDDVDTTGASVRPDYRWNRQREEQELRGYIAERQMVVELTDLDKLGELVEAAVGTGVNQVSPPQLDSSERRATYREALDAAARDARANAEQLAESLGAKLGRVLHVDTGGQHTPVPMPRGRVMAMAADSAEAAETYNAADLSFTANVSVVFELVD